MHLRLLGISAGRERRNLYSWKSSWSGREGNKLADSAAKTCISTEFLFTFE